jgi:hypothetical protein
MSATKKTKGNDILATYAGENWGYQNSKIMYFAGKQNAGQDTVGTVVSPVQAQGVVIDSAVPDTEIFSFTWRGKMRQILVKIQSKGGQPSTCTLRLLAPKAKGEWKSLSGDVTVSNSGTPLLKNPHGMAQWGNMLYFIDYETQQIVVLGANELKGMEGNYTPVNLPIDLEDELANEDAKGQALIALNHRLFALYLVTNAGATAHQPGILVRVTIGSGGLPAADTAIIKTTVGLNPQAIIPVNDGTNIQLLIPAIGGVQSYTGATNGVNSDIRVVPALGATWPTAAPQVVTGAASGTYDIHGVAAAMRGPGSMIYILTQIYSGASTVAQWQIYQGTVGDFLSLKPPTPATTAPTLTEAVTDEKLEVVDQGSITNVTYEGLYFWDLLYEQYPGVGDTGDRLWVAFGTAILVTRAAAGTYGSPTSTADSPVLQPYALYGYNGGVNINAFDLTIDVVNQTKREVSLKHGMRASRAPRAGNALDK